MNFCDLQALQSRSPLFGLLLALSACTITAEPATCRGCHRDCGVLRSECDDACDASEACAVGEPNDAEDDGGEP